MACSVLAVFVFLHIYQLQKRSFKIFNSKNYEKTFTINLFLGVISAILWMSYVKITVLNSSSFEKSILLLNSHNPQ